MSTMFRGHFEHAIDAKGARASPRAFATCSRPRTTCGWSSRPALFDPCLHAYPMKAWEELEAKIAALPQFDSNVVAFRRRYLSAAVECDLDKAGPDPHPAVPPRARGPHEGRAVGGHGPDDRALVAGTVEGRSADERGRASELQERDRGAVPPMNVVNVVPMHLPPPPPRPRSEQHISVLGREVLAALSPVSEGVYVDATLGAGGHTATILETPGARVIGIDRDERALAIARARLARVGDRVTYVHGEFSEIERHLAALGVPQVDGLLAGHRRELHAARRPGPRHELPRGGAARHADGPEPRRDGARAHRAAQRRGAGGRHLPLRRGAPQPEGSRVASSRRPTAASSSTTLDLRRAVVRAVGPARIGGVDPATRTFQALRIAVNGELDELEALLEAAPRIDRAGRRARGDLVPLAGGPHRQARRCVSRRSGSRWTKKPVTAGDDEVEGNPRARSAKLRAARRRGRGGGPRVTQQRPFLDPVDARGGRDGGGVRRAPRRCEGARSISATSSGERAPSRRGCASRSSGVLSLEAASYETPQRVEMVARSLLGMTPPPPERVIPVRGYSAPPAEREPDGEEVRQRAAERRAAVKNLRTPRARWIRIRMGHALRPRWRSAWAASCPAPTASRSRTGTAWSTSPSGSASGGSTSRRSAAPSTTATARRSRRAWRCRASSVDAVEMLRGIEEKYVPMRDPAYAERIAAGALACRSRRVVEKLVPAAPLRVAQAPHLRSRRSRTSARSGTHAALPGARARDRGRGAPLLPEPRARRPAARLRRDRRRGQGGDRAVGLEHELRGNASEVRGLRDRSGRPHLLGGHRGRAGARRAQRPPDDRQGHPVHGRARARGGDEDLRGARRIDRGRRSRAAGRSSRWRAPGATTRTTTRRAIRGPGASAASSIASSPAHDEGVLPSRAQIRRRASSQRDHLLRGGEHGDRQRRHPRHARAQVADVRRRSSAGRPTSATRRSPLGLGEQQASARSSVGFGFGDADGRAAAGRVGGRAAAARPPWSRSRTAAAAFGQGISVTTLQLAMAMASVANHGRLLEPILIKRVHRRARGVTLLARRVAARAPRRAPPRRSRE